MRTACILYSHCYLSFLKQLTSFVALNYLKSIQEDYGFLHVLIVQLTYPSLHPYALNDLTTSSSLPPELLSCIFLHDTRSTTSLNHIKRLLAITHVCRRWREAALGRQLLWTQVFVPYQSELLQVILQRSGNCSLDVTLLSEDELYEDASIASDDFDEEHFFVAAADNIADVLREVHRIRRLGTVNDAFVMSQASMSFETPLEAPLLREININLPRRDGAPALYDLFRSRCLSTCKLQIERLKTTSVSALRRL